MNLAAADFFFMGFLSDVLKWFSTSFVFAILRKVIFSSPFDHDVVVLEDDVAEVKIKPSLKLEIKYSHFYDR